MKKDNKFYKKSPCENCPYRKDAPLQLWHKSEFEGLKENEKEFIGKVYGCHKKDGHVCVGYLMKQDEQGFPNLRLRMVLISHNVDRKYLDSLHCKSELYDSIEEMIEANYPTKK